MLNLYKKLKSYCLGDKIINNKIIEEELNNKIKNLEKELLYSNNEVKNLKKEIEYLTNKLITKEFKESQLDKVSTKDIYVLLNNDLSLKDVFSKLFLSQNYNYYLVLKFPHISKIIDNDGTNIYELQEKVFRLYLKGFRERYGKNYKTNRFDKPINYIWTREMGKTKQAHYNLLINNIKSLSKIDIEKEMNNWKKILEKNNLVNELIWNKYLFYITKINNIINYFYNNKKGYIFKEFNIEKLNMEQKIYFFGTDLETKKSIEEIKKSKKNEY